MSTSDQIRSRGAAAAPSPALALATAARDDPRARDRFIAQAAGAGDSVASIAEHLGLSRQQVHAILETQRQLAGPQPGDQLRSAENTGAWRATEEALEAFTSAEDFERLVQVLLQDIDPTARPLGGVGDRARDAAADLRPGDESIFSISLERQWTRKIRREVARILDFGHEPAFVYGITNRRTTRAAEQRTEEWAKTRGITLRVLGQRWLVAKLMHPAYLELRREYLHLAPPRPTVFLDPGEYRRLLNGRPSSQGLDIQRVGSSNVGERIRARLDSRGCVVLYGAGGLGKTRLVLDIAERAYEGEHWRFLDDLTGLRDDALGELGDGTDLVVVVDNAHRRRDLEQLVALLERREPKPKIVFVVRPFRTEAIDHAARRVWLGALSDEDYVEVRKLANRDIAALLQQPPFELQYEGMIRAVVDLAEGNPLIAILAGGLARDGKSIAELGRADVFQQHVSGLLGSLTERSSEPQSLRQLLAVIAAIGALDPADESAMTITADLLGFAPRAVRGWMDELADLGLVIEDQTRRVAIKPDLLAEHVLVSSFFTERWRPTLSYIDVLDAYGDKYLSDLCAALGRVPYGELDSRHSGLQALRARCELIVEDGNMDVAAKLLRELLPGAEDLILGLFSRLVDRIEDVGAVVSPDAGKALVEATQRINAEVAEGWTLLLRLTAVADDAEVLAAARDAMRSIYRRVPVHSSDHDGQILAMVQQVIASRTRSYLERASTPGQRRAAAAAGQALLTTTFELSQPSVENAREIQLRAYALPASSYTETALGVGIGSVIATFPDVDDAERLRSLEAATELARRAAGFGGPFGIQLTDDARLMAHRALGQFDRFIHERLADFSLPIQAEALGYVLARRDWQERVVDAEAPAPPSLPARSLDLDDYLLLAHPRDVEPPSDRLSWEEDQQAKQAHANRIAERLIADDEWPTQLQKWATWQDEARVLTDKHGTSHWPGVVLTGVAKLHPVRAIAVVDHLAATTSELRLQLAGAMNQLVAADEIDSETMERWLLGDDAFRATIATAIGDVESEPAQRTFRHLAADESEAVRRGVLNGLRYGRSSSPSKIELGVSIAGQLGDIDALLTVLMVAARGGVALSEMLASHAREALLATAAVPRVDEHNLLEVIRRLQEHEDDIALQWAWRRIDWLDTVDYRAWSVDAMPTQLAGPIRGRATKAGLLAALRRYETVDLGGLAGSAVVDLINWIDPAAEEITEFIIRNYHDAENEWRAHRLLRVKLTWEQARARAESLTEALDDPAIVTAVADNMLPTFWSGSRVGHLESALENVSSWATGSGNPQFRRGVESAISTFTRWIEAEKERERRDEELDLWA